MLTIKKDMIKGKHTDINAYSDPNYITDYHNSVAQEIQYCITGTDSCGKEDFCYNTAKAVYYAKNIYLTHDALKDLAYNLMPKANIRLESYEELKIYKEPNSNVYVVSSRTGFCLMKYLGNYEFEVSLNKRLRRYYSDCTPCAQTEKDITVFYEVNKDGQRRGPLYCVEWKLQLQ